MSQPSPAVRNLTWQNLAALQLKTKTAREPYIMISESHAIDLQVLVLTVGVTALSIIHIDWQIVV